MTIGVRRPALLRRTLIANASFAAASALVLMVAGKQVSLAVGIHTAQLGWTLGLPLVAFATYVGLTARPAIPEVRAALGIAAADALWVIGSVFLILLGPLTSTGNAAVADVALVVMIFAALQYHAIGHPGIGAQRKGLRRSRIRLRWLLLGIAMSIVFLVVVGTTGEAALAWIAARRYPPPGRLVDIGGYRLHINCTGAGDPAVVIDAGAGNWSVAWSAIQQRLATGGRVCTFDRAGLGWSDPGPEPRTSAVMAGELHTLLHGAGLSPPFVLVGHSLGGYNVRMFANRYSTEVAAVVLVESASEHQWERLPIEVTEFANQGVRLLRFASIAARLGLLHLVTVPDPHIGRLAPELQPEYRAVLANPAVYDAWRAETRGAFESASEVAHTRPLTPIPVVVVSAGRSFDAFKAVGAHIPFDRANHTWTELQRELVHLSSHGVQLISPTATHDINFDDPNIVVEAISYAQAHVARQPHADIQVHREAEGGTGPDLERPAAKIVDFPRGR